MTKRDDMAAHMSQELTTPPSPEHTLTNLPTEIRNMVLGLILISENLLSICSPPRRGNALREPARDMRRKGEIILWDREESSDFGCLLRVNKQLNQEAGEMFYSKNTFVIGNGAYGSQIQTNTHAMKAFIKRVPPHFLSAITKVNIVIHLRRYPLRWNPSHLCVGYKSDADNLHCISRALVKHFSGLKTIQYEVSSCGPDFSYGAGVKGILTDSECRSELLKTAKIISKHEKIIKISIEPCEWLALTQMLDQILKNRPDLDQA